VMAETVIHRFKDGEMLAVGFPVGDRAVLVYYEYFKGTKIRSEARVYVLKDEKTARLEFVSVNGKEPIRTLGDCPPGTVECPQCTCIDQTVINCVIYNCSRCVAVCFGNTLCLLLCAAIFCPESIHWCCPQECIEMYCCPTP